jgi:phosphoglycolate/pyridoxal phosphate phosphatase family enzyme
MLDRGPGFVGAHGKEGARRFVLPHRGWLFDLDGTVYVGDALIPGAATTIGALREAGRRVAFLSNNPLQSPAEYARKLMRLGIPATGDDVITSSVVLARHLARLDPGAPVFVIGEISLIAALRAAGLEPRSDAHVRWVVISFDRTFDYDKLNVALQAVTRHEAHLIATNPDRTCPVDGGEIPDCAGMIAAVEAVTDRKVDIVVGKPSPIMLEEALEVVALPAGQCAIVGDRLDTDIAMGKRQGMGTVLVLTGITRSGDPRIGEVAPDVVLPSIRDVVS